MAPSRCLWVSRPPRLFWSRRSVGPPPPSRHPGARAARGVPRCRRGGRAQGEAQDCRPRRCPTGRRCRHAPSPTSRTWSTWSARVLVAPLATHRGHLRLTPRLLHRAPCLCPRLARRHRFPRLLRRAGTRGGGAALMLPLPADSKVWSPALAATCSALVAAVAAAAPTSSAPPPRRRPLPGVWGQALRRRADSGLPLALDPCPMTRVPSTKCPRATPRCRGRKPRRTAPRATGRSLHPPGCRPSTPHPSSAADRHYASAARRPRPRRPRPRLPPPRRPRPRHAAASARTTLPQCATSVAFGIALRAPWRRVPRRTRRKTRPQVWPTSLSLLLPRTGHPDVRVYSLAAV
mmetsp:Transcript_1232/g.5044  ORF Transcript_1232/g.5044 Transcript_1232/m.5044 type:complete len:348 (-) Transcript_1232:4371-5414(-)